MSLTQYAGDERQGAAYTGQQSVRVKKHKQPHAWWGELRVSTLPHLHVLYCGRKQKWWCVNLKKLYVKRVYGSVRLELQSSLLTFYAMLVLILFKDGEREG